MRMIGPDGKCVKYDPNRFLRAKCNIKITGAAISDKGQMCHNIRLYMDCDATETPTHTHTSYSPDAREHASSFVFSIIENEIEKLPFTPQIMSRITISVKNNYSTIWNLNS